MAVLIWIQGKLYYKYTYIFVGMLDDVYLQEV